MDRKTAVNEKDYEILRLLGKGKTTEVHPGDIFAIPLFLPSCQMDDYFLDYSKYKFHLDNIYAFEEFLSQL